MTTTGNAKLSKEDLAAKMRLLRLGIGGLRLEAMNGGGVTADDCETLELLAIDIESELDAE
jgi:hypothetical protein